MSDDIPAIDIRIRAKLLESQSLEDLENTLEDFFEVTGIKSGEDNVWVKAILLVQDPEAFHDDKHDLTLTNEEKMALDLDRELEWPAADRNHRLPVWQGNDWHKWKDLPWQQSKIVILCAIGAATQGWAEAAINSAQTYFQPAFQKYIDKPDNVPGVQALGIVGLVNGAPYLCCVISCWLSPLLNKKLGRRRAIFWLTAFSIVFALLQARARSWWELFIYRLFMGIGIGPKSATIPVYVAECAPASIRGSLVMFWQVWTAFGIMLGCFAGIALQDAGEIAGTEKCPVEDQARLLSWECSQNWRFILASPAILPVFLFFYIYTCHESPRWTVAEAHRLQLNQRPLAAQHHYRKAWKALKALSRRRIIAARDMLSQYYLLDEERIDLANRLEQYPTRPWLTPKFSELFGRRRNRRAILAASVCMIAQQFCGVNLIIYYSNYVFGKIHPQSVKGGIPGKTFTIDRQALFYTAGFGCINFLLAAPAFFTIDTVGRRSLLLCTFPFLSLSHFITMIAFAIGGTTGPRIALLGMYLFGIFYSFGEGPVPFVYASESMPLYCREAAMVLVVSVNWLFNWVIAFSGPWMFRRLKPAGTFGFYGSMCIVLWFTILFLVPETRLLRLEEIDHVFDKVRTRDFGSHAWHTFLWQIHVDEKKPPKLYQPNQSSGDMDMHNLAHDGHVSNTEPENGVYHLPLLTPEGSMDRSER